MANANAPGQIPGNIPYKITKAKIGAGMALAPSKTRRDSTMNMWPRLSRLVSPAECKIPPGKKKFCAAGKEKRMPPMPASVMARTDMAMVWRASGAREKENSGKT